MKRFILPLLLIIASGFLQAFTAPFNITVGYTFTPLHTYFMSPTGSDAANGLTTATAWASPNHAVVCGDVIIAAAGTYSSSNFGRTKWGTVSTCPSTTGGIDGTGGVYFATVLCAGPTLNSCIINDTTSNSMVVDKSNWAVEGWNTSTTNGGCLTFYTTTGVITHHIAFINNVVDGCQDNGIASTQFVTDTCPGAGCGSEDYMAVVGAVVHNGAAGNLECFSNISFFAPKNFNATAGTHIYVAGAFSFGALDPSPCAGSAGSSDGNGLILDTISQNSYSGQIVIEQSMFLGNGSSAVQSYSELNGPVFITSVTGYGNEQDPNHRVVLNYDGELLISNSQSPGTSSATGGIYQATVSTINTNNVYACYAGNSDTGNTINGNYCFGVSGHNTHAQDGTFTFNGSNVNTTSSPGFANPVVPTTVPSSGCSTSQTTTACMSTTISNFTPSGGAATLGYQPPGHCTANAKYPTWLKGIVYLQASGFVNGATISENAGLITTPCGM